MQEALQADKKLILQNGTHTEENPDNSVMLSILLLLRFFVPLLLMIWYKLTTSFPLDLNRFLTLPSSLVPTNLWAA